ncbi:MAG TPA: serine/threonine-protein kinase [Pirellulales bacterium]
MNDDFRALTPEEERLLELLVEYDEALEEGTCLAGATPTPPDLDPEMAELFESGQRVLELLAAIRELMAADQPPLCEGAAPPSDVASWVGDFETVLRMVRHDDVDMPQRLGRFLILRELGRGGHGLVLLAHDPILKRHVALKLPRPEALLSRSLRRRFLREAQAAARLTHPNLVSVYEVGEIGPICYIASAYCAGPTLAAWMQLQTDAIAPQLAARIIEQLAQAISYAHEQNILHRDLKPSNVLLEPQLRDECETDVVAVHKALWDYVPKVADFGLAKLSEEDSDGTSTRQGRPLGTPAYMSPEQAEGRLSEVGPATDVYSLGAMLYELLSRKAVFRGATDLDTLRKVLVEEPMSLRKLRRDVPPDLEAICFKCLEKKPAARYASCAALATDLHKFLASMPTDARPLTGLQRATRWTSRNRSVAALLATVMALLLGITTIATVAAVRIGRARDEAERIALREHAAREEANRALSAEQESFALAKLAEQQADIAREAAEAESATSSQISDYLAEVFLAADPIGTGRLGFRLGDEIGRQLTLRDLLDRSAQRARTAFKDQPQARAKLLDTLGKVYSNLGEMERAEPLLREAYTMRCQNPDQQMELASSLLNMGVLLRWKGDYGEAEQYLRQALELRRTIFGPDHINAAEVEFALAWALFETDRFGDERDAARKVECEQLIRHTLEVQRRQLGNNHRDVGLTLSVYTLYLYFMDRNDEAQRMAIASAGVVMQQEGGQALGRGLLEYQRAAHSRGQNRIADAEAAYRASLRTIGEVLGESHPAKVLVMRELAGMLLDQGRVADAEVVGRAALEIGFRVFPQGHPQLSELLLKGADIIESQGKTDEAVSFIERRANIKARVENASLADALRGKLRIVAFRLNQGHLDDAAALLNEVREASKDLPSPESFAISERALYRWLQGVLAGLRGNLEEQERIGRECLTMDNIAFETRDAIEVGMAGVIQTLRPDDNQVDQLLYEPSRGWTASLTASHPHRVMRHLTRVQMLIHQQRLDEAEPLLQMAHGFAHGKTIPGSYFQGLADSLMGSWLAAHDQSAEAEKYLLAGVKNLRVSRGDGHPLTLDAQARLTRFYQETNRAAAAETGPTPAAH